MKQLLGVCTMCMHGLAEGGETCVYLLLSLLYEFNTYCPCLLCTPETLWQAELLGGTFWERIT